MTESFTKITTHLIFPRNSDLHGCSLEITVDDPHGFYLYVSDKETPWDGRICHPVTLYFVKVSKEDDTAHVGLYRTSQIPAESTITIESVKLIRSSGDEFTFPSTVKIFILETSNRPCMTYTREDGTTFPFHVHQDNIAVIVDGEKRYANVGMLQRPRVSSNQYMEIIPEELLSDTSDCDKTIIHGSGALLGLTAGARIEDVEQDRAINVSFFSESSNMAFNVLLGTIPVRYSTYTKLIGKTHYLVLKERIITDEQD